MSSLFDNFDDPFGEFEEAAEEVYNEEAEKDNKENKDDSSGEIIGTIILDESDDEEEKKLKKEEKKPDEKKQKKPKQPQSEDSDCQVISLEELTENVQKISEGANEKVEVKILNSEEQKALVEERTRIANEEAFLKQAKKKNYKTIPRNMQFNPRTKEFEKTHDDFDALINSEFEKEKYFVAQPQPVKKKKVENLPAAISLNEKAKFLGINLANIENHESQTPSTAVTVQRKKNPPKNKENKPNSFQKKSSTLRMAEKYDMKKTKESLNRKIYLLNDKNKEYLKCIYKEAHRMEKKIKEGKFKIGEFKFKSVPSQGTHFFYQVGAYYLRCMITSLVKVADCNNGKITVVTKDDWDKKALKRQLHELKKAKNNSSGSEESNEKFLKNKTKRPVNKKVNKINY